jgi:fibronectin type 3 domain-containing protein
VTTKVTCPNRKAGNVLVSWTSSTSAGVTGYQVTRSTNGATPVVIATVGATATSFDDTTVTGSTTYVYGVASTLQAWTSSATSAPAVTTARKC